MLQRHYVLMAPRHFLDIEKFHIMCVCVCVYPLRVWLQLTNRISIAWGGGLANRVSKLDLGLKREQALA
jgi:hypothetical protein